MQGSWVKGVREVELSCPYYIGVFEITQVQYKLIMGICDSVYKGDMRPVDHVSWYTLRAGPEASEELKDACVWPASNTIGEKSFVGKIRRKTRLEGFDLPTEAQWEYAFNGGKSVPSDERTVITSEMLRYGRFWNNGGWTNEHCVVGSYLPNALGLYDMHGNVSEWCLDFLGDLESGTFMDPLGVPSNLNDKRVLRGETFRTDITMHKEIARTGYYANCWHPTIGFRVVCNIRQANLSDSEAGEARNSHWQQSLLILAVSFMIGLFLCFLTGHFFCKEKKYGGP
jgi:formylglycine-generating enzyme required for sulfatase activity